MTTFLILRGVLVRAARDERAATSRREHPGWRPATRPAADGPIQPPQKEPIMAEQQSNPQNQVDEPGLNETQIAQVQQIVLAAFAEAAAAETKSPSDRMRDAYANRAA